MDLLYETKNFYFFPSNIFHKGFLKVWSPIKFERLTLNYFSIVKNSVQLVKDIQHWSVLLLNYGAMNPLLSFLVRAQSGYHKQSYEVYGKEQMEMLVEKGIKKL